MNRNRLMVGLALAVLLAFVLAAYVYHAFKKVQVSAAGPAMRMTTIVVAAEPLKIGERLDASKVRTIQWPSGSKPAGMFSDISEVANRAVITNLAENEPILADNLASSDSGAGLSATIPEGMRAVSVSVNDVVGVAGFVTPGTMVDILVTGNTVGVGGSSSITRTILENIRVLAAGQKMEQDREGKPETVPVITLLVTPEDAAKLTMASTNGKIQLALRNTVDTKATNPAPVLQSSLFAGGAPAAPVAAPTPGKHVVMHKDAPPPPYSIEVITGGKQEMKNFPNP
ncbi:MAG TPA: Flp pilus assembly protein CpaB [Candidatus Acidoferrales bacterium]|nr:Flp pilus assembly protein CpaB [Candidatus Acidoferrales bacterium]